MKKILVLVLVMVFSIGTIPVFAAFGGEKGASQKAMENASDEAIFHRVGDWFATVGKSDTEKKQILAERKTQRAAARVQKQMEKTKRQAGKKAEEMRKSRGK